MWSFEGSGSSVILSEHETGHFAISGDCLNQDCRPDGGDLSVIPRVSNAKSFFTLLSTGADEASLDLIGRGLLLRSKADPDRSHAMINYYPKVAEYICTVGVTVVICAKSAQRIFDMYKLIFGRADSFHLISVDFIGLKAPLAAHGYKDIASIAEFTDPNTLARRPYFSDGVSFSVHTAPRLSRVSGGTNAGL
jgi:hypothetical protein